MDRRGHQTERGKLRPYARPVEGGEIFQADAQLLMREDLPEELSRKGILRAGNGSRSLYILFSRDDLEAAFPLSPAGPGRVGDVDIESLSPLPAVDDPRFTSAGPDGRIGKWDG